MLKFSKSARVCNRGYLVAWLKPIRTTQVTIQLLLVSPHFEWVSVKRKRVERYHSAYKYTPALVQTHAHWYAHTTLIRSEVKWNLGYILYLIHSNMMLLENQRWPNHTCIHEPIYSTGTQLLLNLKLTLCQPMTPFGVVRFWPHVISWRSSFWR